MNQRSMNLAKEVAHKTTDDAERARMEALLAETAMPIGPLLTSEEGEVK